MSLDPVKLLKKKKKLCDLPLSDFVKIYIIREVHYEQKV